MDAADIGCTCWPIAVPLVVRCCLGCLIVCLSWSALKCELRMVQ